MIAGPNIVKMYVIICVLRELGRVQILKLGTGEWRDLKVSVPKEQLEGAISKLPQKSCPFKFLVCTIDSANSAIMGHLHSASPGEPEKRSEPIPHNCARRAGEFPTSQHAQPQVSPVRPFWALQMTLRSDRRASGGVPHVILSNG